ncbi:hypothetical protein SEA_MAGRITTE_55 [Microbacterium phage Magritte]|nr:hypothetical protein SEA_MAGRITTE_55 [Microbacterium phage Magritte]
MPTGAKVVTIYPSYHAKDLRKRYQAQCSFCQWADKKYLAFQRAANAMEKHNHLERRKHAALA